MWIATYDVAIRRKKCLRAARALQEALIIDHDHPEVHIRLVHFQISVSALENTLPPPVASVFSEARAKLLPSEEALSLDTYNSHYLQRCSTSPPAILATAKVAHVLLQAPLVEVESLVFTTFEDVARQALDISTAVMFVDFLGQIKALRTEEFRSRCDERFELSTIFKPVAELDNLKRVALAGGITVIEIDDDVP